MSESNPSSVGSVAPPIRVSLVEDERGTRENFVALLQRAVGMTCLGAYRSAEEALEKVPLTPPDVLLMDLHLPRLSGVECVRRLKERLPDLRIVMLTKFEDADHLFRALKAGASGYLSKLIPPEELLRAIQQAHEGGAPISAQIAARMVDYFHKQAALENEATELSPREYDVLQLLAGGLPYKEIGHRLGVSYATINGYVKTLYAKLHVHSRAEAVAKLNSKFLKGP